MFTVQTLNPNKQLRSRATDEGNPHAPATCRFINAKCHNCGKMGHIGKACRNKGAGSKTQQRKGPPRRGTVHNIEDNDDLTDSSTPAHTYTHTSSQSTHNLYTINSIPSRLEPIIRKSKWSSIQELLSQSSARRRYSCQLFHSLRIKNKSPCSLYNYTVYL